MRLHLDGARICQRRRRAGRAVASFTTDVGVDVLSFGGTKNGLLGAEAVVVLDPDARPGLRYLRKTSMQLASKMRFISRTAARAARRRPLAAQRAHANAMARGSRRPCERYRGCR